jgi:flagellin
MGLSLNTNIAALDTARLISVTGGQLQSMVQHIGSGKRINSAADDPAGLAISEVLHSQIRGLNQAIMNTQDGVSLIQTADGAMAQTTEVLQRMRELAVQASNGGLSASQTTAITNEITQLQTTLTNIANQTQFNNISILNGSTASIQLQTGANSGNTTTLTLYDARPATLGVNAINLATPAAATTAIGTIDTAIQTVSSNRGAMGAAQSSLENLANSMSVAQVNQQAARSRVLDLDYAQGVSEFSRYQILQQVGTQLLAQANQLNANSVMGLLSGR